MTKNVSPGREREVWFLYLSEVLRMLGVRCGSCALRWRLGLLCAPWVEIYNVFSRAMAVAPLDLSTRGSRGRCEFALGGVAARPTKACAGQSYCELGANLHLTDANAALAHISRIFSTGDAVMHCLPPRKHPERNGKYFALNWLFGDYCRFSR